MSYVGINLAVEASLEVEPDGRISISWRDGSSLKRNEIYPSLAIALMRLAVLDHMAANNSYCVHHLPEQCSKRAEDYLSEVTRPRGRSIRFRVPMGGPTRRIISELGRVRRKSESQ